MIKGKEWGSKTGTVFRNKMKRAFETWVLLRVKRMVCKGQDRQGVQMYNAMSLRYKVKGTKDTTYR